MSNILTIFHFDKVSGQDFKHFVIFLTEVVCDRDTILKMTRIRLNLIVNNNYICKGSIPQKNGQIFDIDAVLKDKETLLSGEDVIKELMTPKRL